MVLETFVGARTLTMRTCTNQYRTFFSLRPLQKLNLTQVQIHHKNRIREMALVFTYIVQRSYFYIRRRRKRLVHVDKLKTKEE